MYPQFSLKEIQGYGYDDYELRNINVIDGLGEGTGSSLSDDRKDKSTHDMKVVEV